MVLALLKNKDILTILKEGIEMKKYDKEYSTQYTPEKNYLLSCGIAPTFVKVINGVTTYKYEKTASLFDTLAQFYYEYYK